jgi:hypothetical protein
VEAGAEDVAEKGVGARHERVEVEAVALYEQAREEE